MNHESRLRPRSDVTSETASTSRQEGRVFDTPEEALRADRLITPVPPTLARRLASSLDGPTTPTRPRLPWWKRWFSD